MSASDAAEGGRDEPIDVEWEPAAERRRPRGEPEDRGYGTSDSRGVGIGAVLGLFALSTIFGALLGAVVSRSPFLDRLGGKPAALIGAAQPSVDTREIDQRLAKLETNWRTVETAADGGGGAALTGRLINLQEAVQALQGKIGDADIAALAQQVAAIKADTDTIRQQSESASLAARAAFAVAAASEAARASGPFEQAYTTLESVLPQNPDILALAPLSKTGAPSRQELKDQFLKIEDDVVRAARISGAGAGFWGRVQAFLAQFVTVRRTGEGETPVGMVERAAERLRNDDVAGAVAELNRLTGPAAQVAGPWIQRARARLEIDARLAAIRSELSRGR